MPLADSPLAEIGRHYLDPHDATAWTGLLRPAFRLRPRVAGEAVAGYLGGNPQLPDDVAWPVWEGHGPLTFVGAVDCGALPGLELDIPLPAQGALLFFYFDGQYERGPDDAGFKDAGSADTRFEDAADDTVGFWDPQSLTGGARVLYLEADAEMNDRSAPAGISAFPLVLLGGEVIATEPGLESAAFTGTFGDPYDPQSPVGAVTSDEFLTAVDSVRYPQAPHHRIGGYPMPVQGPVEDEAAHAPRPDGSPRDDADRAALAARLVLLAQIDTDDRAGMCWGDAGRLYWLIDPDDLAARRFEAATFTWQCG
jgi:Domain of unknown function (DUF1963)